MKKLPNNALTRRKFLKSSAAAAVLGSLKPA